MRPGPRDPWVSPWQRTDWLCVLAIVAWGLFWLVPGLAHPAIHDWDEGLHQVVARGTYDTFFYPHMYEDPLYPTNPEHWWYSGVWLLKPAGPFWFGATMMHLVGVQPLALRLGSLLGELGAAVALFLMVRASAGRAWSLIAALGFLALPFGWTLTQGHFFGDVTDCTLVGWVTLSMALLLWSVEKDSWKWAAAAGAAVGVAYLCKTLLALAPIGVAGVMWALGVVRFSAGPRFKSLLAMVGAAIAVAAPWNIYAARTWPDVFFANSRLAFGHIFSNSGVDLGSWRRPFDAILNEVNATELNPFPVAMGVLVAGWLVIRAIRRREFVVVGIALWLVATWTAHSIVAVKAPAHVWNAVPAFFAGLALIANDVWRSPALGGALVAGLASRAAITAWPSLARLRELLPASFEQTRAQPGLAEGVTLIVAAAVLFAIAGWVKPLRAYLGPAVAVASSLLLGWFLLMEEPTALRVAAAAQREPGRISYTRELGLALDARLPRKSVLWQAVDFDPPGQFEVQNLMMWSGRMTYRRAPDLPLAQSRGYGSYLISPAAEPFAPVEGVPANAWLRAYDVQRPGPPAPLPAGVMPVSGRAGNLEVLGAAWGPIDGEKDRWAFYVKPTGIPGPLPVIFHTADGPQAQVLQPESTLRHRAGLADAAWFVLPAVGPRARDVTALELGGARVTLPGSR